MTVLYELDSVSFKSLPLVSNGKSITAVPEQNNTISNTRMAIVWWHPCIKPTATKGHMIPPNLPTELATPTPVVLTEVGYIYKMKKRKNYIRETQE